MPKTNKLALPKDLTTKLKQKMLDRNEDLILDKLEEIEIHKREINKLVKDINQLSEFNYIDAE